MVKSHVRAMTASAGLVFLVGCQAVAGIEDLQLIDDGGGDDATSDSQVILDASDTSLGDGPRDTSNPGDSSIGDSTGIDTTSDKDSTTAADSFVPTDTFVGDTALPDTAKPDTFVPPDTAPPPCPTGGQPMVRVTSAKGTFCIDTNEVTIKQMDAYKASGFSPLTKPTICSTIPEWNREVSAVDDDPTYNVQWCSAWAYCQSVKKRLCGRTDKTIAPSATNSEYAWTCGNGSLATAYPYGVGFVLASCDAEVLRSTPSVVTSHPACHGAVSPYTSVFNMSGSVAEWTDDCPDSTHCWARGGYFGSNRTLATCTSIESIVISAEEAGTGFRCCAD